MHKKAQSEMIGFAIILILVMVIILIFVSFSIHKKQAKVQDSEVQGFIQASLQYTTTCASQWIPNYQNVKDLIFMCMNNQSCYPENNKIMNSCDVLNKTMNQMLNNSWNVGKDWPDKGYNFVIMGKGKTLLNITKGNITSASRGATQDFDGGVEIDLTVYS